MRRLLILIALLSAAMQVMAADVSVSSALSMAQRFLVNRSSKGSFNAATPTVKWVHQEMNSSRANKAAYYVVNTDRGFVVVAGDDRAQEILAYGDGSLKDMNNLPENMKFWLDTYKQQMEYLQAHPGLEVEKPSFKGNRTESIEPMLVAKWDQGYPFYNQCPMDGDRRGQTGCAATSLAQVFYKWQYP
ncbi:MAG: Spi family protease inhibitor, partial [Muribaculaceae bacterium]|nr:Spi family protease inhibitor [Muribaculaceae bacterium]